MLCYVRRNWRNGSTLNDSDLLTLNTALKNDSRQKRKKNQIVHKISKKEKNERKGWGWGGGKCLGITVWEP